LCFFDLDKFKQVNDTLGHACGDDLLVEVSRRLKANVRVSDTVARIAGDEYALLLRDVDLATARAVAEKLMQYVENPAHIGTQELQVSGSMGIALFPDHGTDVDALLKNADSAMYVAKRSGTRVETYRQDAAGRVATESHGAMIADMKNGRNEAAPQ
jgi:diguanylate cyclase (GGDEF)-like protein